MIPVEVVLHTQAVAAVAAANKEVRQAAQAEQP
jgi:hypothetical protein